jgi:transposase
LSAAARIVELEQENAYLLGELTAVKHQLDWLKRQLFGEKSEKRLTIDPAIQGDLLSVLGVESPAPKIPEPETITYQRRKKTREGTVNDSGLRFSDDVPKEVIVLRDPGFDALADNEREVIGEKVSYRLAQRPGSYLVLEYRRLVYKRLSDQKIVTTPSPANVLEKSSTDVSLLAGMLIDKFCYHLPLYRQHQRLAQAGVRVSRTSLTNWTSRSIDLLEPIVDAQMQQLLLSKVIAMDETPIKAGKLKKGKMRQAYLWPMYGENDEIVFRYASSRAHRYVQDWLQGYSGTLLSDGYAAYSAYAKQNQQVTHAQCWSHCRRKFEQAKDHEPQASAEALALIGTMYRHEGVIRDRQLRGADKLAYRSKHIEPVVSAFWAWCDEQCHRPDLLPKNPLSTALKYARKRVASLQVFLGDPDVPIDTNHLERSLRPIPLGKKNWMFCWTEIGAERVGIIQSLLVTCKLQGIDPYTYLVDVLQRISIHPASRVIELTPRQWKSHFAENPMQSDVATVKP